jgi:hypothetical protein
MKYQKNFNNQSLNLISAKLEELNQLQLEEIYKSVTVVKYLKSFYKNAYDGNYDQDENIFQYSPLDEDLENITFMNRELYLSKNGVKVIRTYDSDLYSDLLMCMKVKLFVDNSVYEKIYYSREQKIEFLKNNQFIEEKWQLIN